MPQTRGRKKTPPWVTSLVGFHSHHSAQKGPIWLVTFMQYDLGYFDDETYRLEPIQNPFGPKVLPVRSE
jgi:hypothetical protein